MVLKTGEKGRFSQEYESGGEASVGMWREAHIALK